MRYAKLLAKMTLEEKCILLAGKNTWQTYDFPHRNVPSIWFSDGPHGLRKQLGTADHLGLHDSEAATCFPTAATVANSWDEALGEEIGRALGAEAAAKDVQVLLGPGLNIKRSPLCGRNFEYFSEDPYLSGKLAAAYIRGIQASGGSACPKHFAVNSQEERRMSSNSVVDERALREIYLTGFEIAVKEGKPKAIMSSYNQVNGDYANENPHLLLDILRREWGFDGAVITDWGGDNDHIQAVKNGGSLQMPGPGLAAARELLQAVKNGTLSEADIDVRADEVLKLVFSVKTSPAPVDTKAHHALACRAAAESAVLLKNQGQLLPLAPGTRVAVLGDFAWKARYQGAGSSVVKPTMLDQLLPALETTNLTVCASAKAFHRSGKPDPVLLQEAVDAAKQADVVLLCLGLPEISETEGVDRSHIRLPYNQTQVLEAVARVNARVVVVLSAGSVVDMEWEAKAHAILHGYLGGQAGATAMAQLLTGQCNPSGKLAETYPLTGSDSPVYEIYPGKEPNVLYKESIYVGYRYYDKVRKPVRYPFGYGLSYTTFAYGDLQVSREAVTFTVTNTGSVSGSETAQLYVAKPESEFFRAEQELKGFAKVFLQPGEAKTVTIPLDDKAFRYFNVKTGCWEMEGGTYCLRVGASSRDLRLHASLEIPGSGAPAPYNIPLPSYECGEVRLVSDPEFEALLGTSLPKENKRIHRNSALRDLKTSRAPLGWLAYWVLTKLRARTQKSGEPDLNVEFQYNMPLRGFAKFAGGFVDMGVVDGLVLEMRGFWLLGLLRAAWGVISCTVCNGMLSAKLKQQAKEGRGD